MRPLWRTMRTGGASSLLLAAVFAQACAPMFSDARLVGPGKAEVTPNVSAVGFSGGGETEHVLNQFGVQAVVGVHGRADVGVGYARLQAAEGGDGINAVGFGPRLALVPNRIALALPFGFAFGGEVEATRSWQWQPAVLFTVPLTDRIDFNPSARVLIPFCDGCDTMVGANAGFGISAATRRLTFRPEFGLIFKPGESGVVWSFGFGVSFRGR